MNCKLIEVQPQGYCKGVENAIARVLQLRQKRPHETITVLGALVHNRYVTDILNRQNIRTLEAHGKTRLELLDEIDSGIVVITAHGASQGVREKAKQKGLELFDATCPFVLATQKVISTHLDRGETILYVGKNGHPESEAAISDSDQIHLIETEKDLPDGLSGPLFATNQTTLSTQDLKQVFAAIQKKYPQTAFHDEICNATRIRQQAVRDLAGQHVDLLIVLGDPTSNNTRKLAQTGMETGIPRVVQIESARQMDPNWIEDGMTIAVTSGASTPGFLRQDLLEKIKSIIQG